MQQAAEVLRDPASFVEVDPDTGCWYYPHRDSSGFGPFLVFFSVAFGTPPEGMELFHLCEGGPFGCIRPSHLDIAPQGSEMRDVPDPAIVPAPLPDFAQRLQREREARRVPVGRFARELGIPSATYRTWEKGRHLPSVEAQHEIARRLGWDGHLRRFAVLVALERTVEARSAGEAAQEALRGLEMDGRPTKAEVLRCHVRP